jgi:translation initiation factor IF-1
MSHIGSTHVKKSDLIKGGKKKSIVKQELQLATADEQYGRIVGPLGSLQFKVDLSDGTQVRAKAGNTFKKCKRNPRGEIIKSGDLVKIDYYLGIYSINHIYTPSDEEELSKRGLLDTSVTAKTIIDILNNDDVDVEGLDENWLEDI